jgi:hypothetical protein
MASVETGLFGMKKLSFSLENFTQQGIAGTTGVLAILSSISF